MKATAKKTPKVALVFSGGPAPSANAVISAAALSFINARIPLIGFFDGFEHLENYDDKNRFSLVEGIHYLNIDSSISRIRNRRGVFLRTSRANPGRAVHCLEDLQDPQKNRNLVNIINIFERLGLNCLITIGGDDTLKTANFLSLMGLPVIHIPKTIDNDYFGIPWTFGYWSSVQYYQEALLNLKADGESTNSYFIVELMGRKAGWITYASGIAGESVMMISNEDIGGRVMDVEKIAAGIVETILIRERKNKYYGVICLAEGLAEKLPDKIKPVEKDRHGNLLFGAAEVGRIIRDTAEKIYTKKTGRKKKIIYKQIGYETRNTPPSSFDVVLGSMLGYGAYKLYHEGNFGNMVSVSDNFQVISVPFSELIDPVTMLTRLRIVPKGSDFFVLKEALSFKLIE